MLSGFGVFAQQQASYTQYMFNGMAINPGYIGTHEALSFTALGRWQWVGMEGAPNTQTFAVHTPIKSKNIGVGLQAVRDEIAVSRFTTVMAGYAYRLPISGGYLSMGLQGGFQSFNANYNDAYTLGSDPTFQQSYSAFKPNFGAGLFYYNAIWYAGVSAPELLNHHIEQDGQSVFNTERHYFMTGGAVFTLTPDIKMKPNLLVKVINGAPVSVDYNVNFLFKEVLWLGFSYRPPESVSFLVELNISQNLRFGYAMDVVTNATLSQSANTSHEMMLNYRIPLRKDQVVTPRYF